MPIPRERGEPMLWRMILVGLLLVLAAPAGAHPADPVLWKTKFADGSLSKWEADGCGGEFNSGGGEMSVTPGTECRTFAIHG